MAKPISASFILLVVLLLLVFQQICSFHAAQDHLYDQHHDHTNTTTKCLEYERRALLQFKQDLYDPAHRLSSWSSTTGTGDDDCCSWTGITCSTTNLTTIGFGAHVLKIDLRNNNNNQLSSTALVGELHPSLLLLKHLQYLDLSFNNFNGSIGIPAFIGSFRELKCLYLSTAGFTGNVPPHLGNLSSLQSLDLSDYYSGSQTRISIDDTTWISRLGSLEYLDLSYVNLTKDSNWLHSLNMLPSLLEIRLSGCGLYATSLSLPYVNFTSLSTLDLSGNSISSTIIPPWLFNLSRLEYLYLSRNSLSGSIPESIGNLGALQYLYLSFNELNGTIPQSIGQLSELLELSLEHNALTGIIPHEIGNLKKLLSLDLSENSLSGSIPHEIGNLKKLRSLDLSENSLSGSIPHEIGNLKKLRSLDLSENSLSGSVPGSIGSLLSLELLHLYNNRLNGTIPVSLGQLSRLSDLDLGNNCLKGVLSEAHLVNLTRLDTLTLSPNSLILRVGSDWVPPFQLQYLSSCVVGPKFPAWLRTQANLIWLDMSSAGISDAFPDWFWNLTGTIGYLNLSQNAIRGMLPRFLNLSSLEEIDLSSNHLEGLVPQIPSSTFVIDLSNNSFSGPIDTIISDPMPELSYLSLSMNNINGTIPFSLCNATELDTLDLSKNQLFGELPDCWSDHNWIIVMDFSNNNVSGDVPNSICSLPNLESLHLSNNGFSGLFPLSLRNCTKLITLDLSHNKFHGNIPDWMVESMPKIKILSLRWNDFSGYLPPQLSNLSELHILDLSNNKLSGSIPENFGEFNAMISVNEASRISDMIVLNVQSYRDTLMVVIKGQEHEYEKIIMALANVMDLSNNHLSGSIPEKLLSLSALQILNLSRNHLIGGIPDKIGELQSLESLDLSMNNLTGVIPSSLDNLNSLGRLNLSYNNLSGRIPSGKHFDTFGDPSIYIGNHDLCGLPLDKNCTSDKESPSSTYENNDRSDEEWFYISMGIGFVFGLWTVFVIMLFKKNWRIAYFRSMDSIYDRVYVAVMVFFNRVKRKCQGKA